MEVWGGDKGKVHSIPVLETAVNDGFHLHRINFDGTIQPATIYELTQIVDVENVLLRKQLCK